MGSYYSTVSSPREQKQLLVVVGGGTAVYAVAYALAKNPNKDVRVLEAGDFVQFTHRGKKSISTLWVNIDKNPTQLGAADIPFMQANLLCCSDIWHPYVFSIKSNALKGVGGNMNCSGGTFNLPDDLQFEVWKVSQLNRPALAKQIAETINLIEPQPKDPLFS